MLPCECTGCATRTLRDGAPLAPATCMGTTTQLLEEGDLAYERGDGPELAAIARKLSVRVGDPLRDRLLVLALAGGTRPPQWPQLRTQIAERLLIAGT